AGRVGRIGPARAVRRRDGVGDRGGGVGGGGLGLRGVGRVGPTCGKVWGGGVAVLGEPEEAEAGGGDGDDGKGADDAAGRRWGWRGDAPGGDQRRGGAGGIGVGVGGPGSGAGPPGGGRGGAGAGGGAGGAGKGADDAGGGGGGWGGDAPGGDQRRGVAGGIGVGVGGPDRSAGPLCGQLGIVGAAGVQGAHAGPGFVDAGAEGAVPSLAAVAVGVQPALQQAVVVEQLRLRGVGPRAEDAVGAGALGEQNLRDEA